MNRRRKADLESWELEIVQSQLNHLVENLETLHNIDNGARIILFEDGDVTDEERCKAEWKVAYYKAALARIEYLIANDNEPPMDKELADLIAGDW